MHVKHLHPVKTNVKLGRKRKIMINKLKINSWNYVCPLQYRKKLDLFTIHGN